MECPVIIRWEPLVELPVLRWLSPDTRGLAGRLNQAMAELEAARQHVAGLGDAIDLLRREVDTRHLIQSFWAEVYGEWDRTRRRGVPVELPEGVSGAVATNVRSILALTAHLRQLALQERQAQPAADPQPDPRSVRYFFLVSYLPAMGPRLLAHQRYRTSGAIGRFERAGFSDLADLTPANIQTLPPRAARALRRLRDFAMETGVLPDQPAADPAEEGVGDADRA